MADKQMIYWAQFKYGSARLVSVEVKKETAKQYQTGESKAIMGISAYVSLRLSKDNPNVFESYMDAIDYLIREGDVAVDRYEEQLEKAEREVAKLQQFRTMLEESASSDV